MLNVLLKLKLSLNSVFIDLIMCLFYRDGVISSTGTLYAVFSNSAFLVWWWETASFSRRWKPLASHENPRGGSLFSGPSDYCNTLVHQLVRFWKLTLLHLHHSHPGAVPTNRKSRSHDLIPENVTWDPTEKFIVGIFWVLQQPFQNGTWKPQNCGKTCQLHFWG